MTDNHTPTRKPATTDTDILRQAAEKARKLVGIGVPPGPWDQRTGTSVYADAHGPAQKWVADTANSATAEHIAAWHPSVAAAIADLWSAAADRMDRYYQRTAEGLNERLLVHAATTFLNQP